MQPSLLLSPSWTIQNSLRCSTNVPSFRVQFLVNSLHRSVPFFTSTDNWDPCIVPVFANLLSSLPFSKKLHHYRAIFPNKTFCKTLKSRRCYLVADNLSVGQKEPGDTTSNGVRVRYDWIDQGKIEGKELGMTRNRRGKESEEKEGEEMIVIKSHESVKHESIFSCRTFARRHGKISPLFRSVA